MSIRPAKPADEDSLLRWKSEIQDLQLWSTSDIPVLGRSWETLFQYLDRTPADLQLQIDSLILADLAYI